VDVKLVVLISILAVACFTDLRQQKVYNWLTFPAMALGFVFNTAAHSWPGLGISLAGLVVGGLVFFPAFWMEGMGAGDIKLMAAVGAFMGWKFALNAAVDTAIIGGILAVVFLLIKGELRNTLKRMVRIIFPDRSLRGNSEVNAYSYALPYAVVISLGTVAARFFPSFIALP
jgi:prepilin peptidase CpaA